MRLLLAVLIMFGITSGADARKQDRTYTIRDINSCSYYLDAYSRTTFYDGYRIDGPHEAWHVFGFINGYLTSYNAFTDNGIEDIAAGLSNTDVYRWIASWCRDNSSKDLHHAVYALIQSRL